MLGLVYSDWRVFTIINIHKSKEKNEKINNPIYNWSTRHNCNLNVEKALTGDGSISLICKNGEGTITLKFDPTSDTAISAKRQDGSDYVVEGIDEKIEKVGVMRFIEDFTHDFEIHKGGTCFKR